MLIVEDLHFVSFDEITRLHIRCDDMRFDRLLTGDQGHHDRKNTTITSFKFDAEYYRSHMDKFHLRRRTSRSKLLKRMMKFIRSLVNVQRVWFITSQYRIKRWLNINECREVIRDGVQLDRGIIQLVGDEDLMREAHDIEEELRVIRPEITFRTEKWLV
jgi:hypothetical protein